MEEENIIQLGDIVKIISDETHKMHESSFYVSYVDPLHSVELIHIGSMETYILPIVKGKFLDEDIRQVHILNRSIHKGYCRQNGLFPGTWITMDFGGEIPSIVTAQISHLEEDMITLITYPENEILYLDFEYKGIPKHIPIMKICIRDKPSSYDGTDPNNPDLSPSAEDLLEEAGEELNMTYQDNGDIVVNVPTNMAVDETYKDTLGTLLNQTRIQETDDVIEYQIERASQFTKYKLETQINHLLDDLLASVSDANRKDRVLRNIYTHIQRFQELREQFSTYDEYGQITGALKKNPILHKPLAHALLQMNKPIPWIKPVVSQYKKLYDVDSTFSIYDATSISTLDAIQNENEFETDFMRINYNNNDQVKYQSLQQELGSITRPFSYEWSTKDCLIHDVEIQHDMDFIVSNDGKFRATSVLADPSRTSHTKLQNALFSTSRYISSVDYPAYDPRKRETKSAILMEGDKAAIHSLLYMPKAFIDYSKLYLPASTILDKANKHNNMMYLFALLTPAMKKKMNVQEVVLDVKQFIDKDQSIIPLEHNLRHVKLEEYQESLEDKTNLETYRLFLQQSIPNIFTIIHEFLKPRQNLYNLSDYLYALESFYIYHSDLSFKANETIKYQIRDNIQEFVNRYQEQLQSYNRLKLYKFPIKAMRTSDVYNRIGINLFSDHFDYQHMIFSHYLLDAQTLTNEEIMYQLLLKDDAALFDKVVQITNLDLVSPTELLPEDFDEDEEFVPLTKGMCMRRNLSKRYSSIKELQDDNDQRELEYDDEFDDTNYDIMKQYKHEKESMDNEVFVDFLAEQLIMKHKCPRSLSESMAKTLIRGKKIVQDGDYAVLELRPQYVDGDESALSEKEKENLSIEADIRRTVNYYRRTKHVWIYDKNIDENAFVDSNTLLCNVKNACYRSKNTCEDMVNETQPRLRKQTKQEIIQEFSERFTEEIGQKKKSLEDSIQYLQSRLEQRLISERFLRRLFDLKAFAYGQSAVFLESNTSPYQYLHDLIIQPHFDFYKKQEYIIKIVQNYCRDPLPSEDPHWKYCLKTNAKLMENSLYRLAIAFQNNEYNKVLQHLCRTVGKEDGEYVYDKETGCILKTIEYQEDATQDYQRTRDVDEDDLEAIFDELAIDDTTAMEVNVSEKQTKIYHFDAETQYFFNLLQAFCKKGEGIDVEVESIQEPVLQLCSSLMTEKKIFMSEKIYEKQQEERKKKNPKSTAPTYKKYIATKKLEVLVCSLIVAVQCLIPSIKKRKTFPGCVQSFHGYPLESGMDDLSTVVYFACILRKKSRDTDSLPWNTVPKKENAMEDRLKKMLEQFVVPHPYSQGLLDKKRIYDREHAKDYDIPETIDVAKNWHRFTPIIVPFSVMNGKAPLRNVSEGFHNEMMSTLKQGKKSQWDHIGVLNHKVDLFSAAVIESIKTYVQDQDALLTTQSKIPFLQNACCVNGKTFETPLNYFIQEDERIQLYVNQCIRNSLALRDIHWLAKAYFIHEKPQSNRVSNGNDLIHQSSNQTNKQNAYKGYNSTILYQAMIQYCFLDNDTVPIPDALKVICSEKPENYNTKASLEEKIDFLKNNGLRLSETKFVEMMRLIHRRNCIQIHSYDLNFRADLKGSLTQMESIIENYQQIPDSLQRFVTIFWKIFDQETEELEAIEKEDEYVFVSCVEEEENKENKEDTNTPKDLSPIEQKHNQFIEFVTPEIERLKGSFRTFLKNQKRNGFSEAKLKTIFEKLFPADEESIHCISYCTFMKNYLYALCVEYPLRITHYHSHTHNEGEKYKVHIPKYWPITPSDELNLHKFMKEIDQLLDPFYQDTHLMTLMNHIRPLLRAISSILQYFYTFFPQTKTKLYTRLFQYLCLIVFHLHVELSQDSKIASETFQAIQKEENADLEDMVEIRDFVPVDDVGEAIQSRLGELFEVYLHKVLSRKHDYTTMSYTDIMKQIERSAEEEKHSIKEHFRKMSKEERRAEMLMKSLHLGIFNVNNKKLISYGHEETTDLFGAVVSEEQMDTLENQVMEQVLNPDQMAAQMDPVEMPEENDPDAEGFLDDPEEDMFDMVENAFEQNFDQ